MKLTGLPGELQEGWVVFLALAYLISRCSLAQFIASMESYSLQFDPGAFGIPRIGTPVLPMKPGTAVKLSITSRAHFQFLHPSAWQTFIRFWTAGVIEKVSRCRGVLVLRLRWNQIGSGFRGCHQVGTV